MNLQAIAAALGGDVVGGQVLCPGPNHSPKDRSLAVRPVGDAFEKWLIHSHAGDGWRDCLDHVRRLLGLPTSDTFDERLSRSACGHVKRWDLSSPREETGGADAPREGRDGERRAREIWEKSRDPVGTIVEKYLAGRHLTLPESAEHAIRFHPACPWERGHKPAMVAAFRDIANPRVVCGIHRTALTPDGTKLDRKMLGRARDAAIMLDPDEAVATGLAISEGVESGLAGRALGWRPCWALGSAGAIAKFPVLSGIECLNIMAELDDGGANARAIEEVGTRWLNEGREVLTIWSRVGGDMNDALRRLA